MKYKKREAKLKARILAWEKSNPAYQRAHKKPGSQKK